MEVCAIYSSSCICDGEGRFGSNLHTHNRGGEDSVSLSLFKEHNRGRELWGEAVCDLKPFGRRGSTIPTSAQTFSG